MPVASECFGYGGQGTYSGAPIAYAGVATISPDIFTASERARRLSNQEAEPVRKLFFAGVEDMLDSTEELRVYSLHLEGQPLFAIQRAFHDWASKPEYNPRKARQQSLKMIFAIGTMRDGHFQLLHWKENIEDENEQILGTIHLKNGRDFLINTVSHPEGQFFRIYGIRGGKPTLIYCGGGASC